jgi:hypothetical protein
MGDPKNLVSTWRQGAFVDQRQYAGWTDKQKEVADLQEKCLVRPTPLGNAVCITTNPDDAKWIAERLNMAVKLQSDNKRMLDMLKEVQDNLKHNQGKGLGIRVKLKLSKLINDIERGDSNG